MSTQDEQQQPPRRLYRGNCHCGEFVYEVEMPEIKSGFDCNCNICHKKAYLWSFLDDKSTFNVVKGTEDALSCYLFGSKKLAHRFCPKCATPVMGNSEVMGRAINIRAIQGLEARDLPTQPFDGASLGDKYVPPEHKGPLPVAIEGHKLYTGSCHCGVVTLALMSKPLDETYDGRMVDCNCSVCSRNGYRWAYPTNEQVVLHASDPSQLGRYSFPPRFILNKTFCKVCGVFMTNEYNHLTEEQRQALGAVPAEGFPDQIKTHHPVNLRVFPDVDLTKLQPPLMDDGANNIPPHYENP